MDDLIELRAALKELVKALETERASVLRIIRVIEKKIEDEPIPVTIKRESMVME